MSVENNKQLNWKMLS